MLDTARLSILPHFRSKSTLFPVDKIGARHASAGRHRRRRRRRRRRRHCRSFQEFISNACDSLELLCEASQMTFYIETYRFQKMLVLLLVNNADG